MTQTNFIPDRPKNLSMPQPPLARPTPSMQGLMAALDPNPDDLVVDISAGAGQYALAIAGYFKETKGKGIVFACDASPVKNRTLDHSAAILGLSRHLNPIGLDSMAPQSLPFTDERMDGVLSVDGIHLKRQPLSYLQEVARILKPCGTLLIAESAGHSSFGSPVAGRRPSTAEDLFPLLREAGLDIIITLEASQYRWVLRAMKPIIVPS